MNHSQRPLPSFKNPPVLEVALSVQFDPLTALRTSHVGLFWAERRRDFPRVEEHFPIESKAEAFGPQAPQRVGVRVEGIDAPPALRVWLLNDAGTELIQVQQNRFVHNWRKVSGDEQYPHYEHVRSTFKFEIERFRQFADSEKLGQLLPNQCEVTYVNHIVAGDAWQRHGQLGNVITTWSNNYADQFLAEPEEVRFVAHYTIPNASGQPIGRLHVDLQPAYRSADNTPIFVLTLTARGRPESATIEGTLGFLDLGHEWIVRGFASITSVSMHQTWGRLQ